MSALPGNFEVRTTGVFSVICLKSEAKFAAAPKAVVKAAPETAAKDLAWVAGMLGYHKKTSAI